MAISDATKVRRIQVYLPEELIQWLDHQKPSNRSRAVQVAVETYRLLHALASCGALLDDVEGLVADSKRGRPNLMRRWLLERERIELMGIEDEHGRDLRGAE